MGSQAAAPAALLRDCASTQPRCATGVSRRSLLGGFIALLVTSSTGACEKSRGVIVDRLIRNDAVVVRATWTLGPTTLGLAYEVENRAGEDLYLLDAPFVLDHGMLTGAGFLGYMIREERVLTVCRGVLRIPDGLQVEAPEVPYARVLRSGNTVGSSVASPLPLAYSNPYEWADGKQTYHFSAIRLRIGFVRAGEWLKRSETRLLDGREVLRLHYRDIIDLQQFADSPEQVISIEVVHSP